MEPSYIKYIYEFYNKLTEAYGFKVKTESKEGQSYLIEYCSKNFVVKVEKYYQEFYTSIYKINKPDDEINLFNLLEYLRQGDSNIPKSEYYRKEKVIEECYRKQLVHSSSVFYENFNLINDFFSDDYYKIKIAEFGKYWKSKHPEFYKKD